MAASNPSFEKLPTELRQQILAETDLVGDKNAASSEKALITSEEYFKVSSQFEEDARQVFFSSNRLVLESSEPSFTQSYFDDLSHEDLQRIRLLDFQFTIIQPDRWTDAKQKQWEELVEFVAKNMNIPHLSLSLDLGQAHSVFVDRQVEEQQLDWMREIHEKLVQPLKANPVFKQLKQFHLFWACSHADETRLEKEVKGQEYDSVKDGKVPYQKRDPDQPHNANSGVENELGQL
jgi:hypothetical protein